MSDQPAGEKSHAPSEKRLRDAVGKGNVLRSREVATAAAVGAGALWLKLAGPWLLARMELGAQTSLFFDRGALESFQPGQMLQDLAWSLLPPILTLGLAVMAVQERVDLPRSFVAKLRAGHARRLRCGVSS